MIVGGRAGVVSLIGLVVVTPVNGRFHAPCKVGTGTVGTGTAGIVAALARLALVILRLVNRGGRLVPATDIIFGVIEMLRKRAGGFWPCPCWAWRMTLSRQDGV